MKTIAFGWLAIIILVFVVALTACSSAPIVKTVEVPVAVKCTPPVIPKPAFQYPACVVPGETLFNLAKCALADLRLHMGYETELEAGLTSCSP
jgi:hypothetical protein